MSDTTVRSPSDSNPGHQKSESSSSIIAHEQVPATQRSAPPLSVSGDESVYSPEPLTPRLSYEERTPGMGEIPKYLISAVILGAAFGAMLWLWNLKEDPKGQDSNELVPRVATYEAQSYAGQLDLVLSGTVVPYREIKVAAEVSGNIIKKYAACESGNFVKKGTKLLDIDPITYELDIKTKQAEVNQAEKMLAETQAEIVGVERNIKLAKRDYDLSKSDFDRNLRIKSSLSSSELDQSERNFLNAETTLTSRENNLNMLNARVSRLDAAITLSQAQLERSQLNLQKTTIVAPDDGVIVREVVQEGDNVTPGAQLIMFEDTSRSEVVCNLSSSDLAWIRSNSVEPDEADTDNSTQRFSVYHLPKTKVTVYEPGKKDIFWDGVLERFDGIGRDESTRTIPVRITIESPVKSTDFGKHALVRGMYVKCQIKVDTLTDASERKFLKFPTVALRSGKYVWIVRDRKLQRVAVAVVDYAEQDEEGIGAKVVVVQQKEGSLQPGDQVVTTPLSQPSTGAQVLLEDDPVVDALEDGPVVDADSKPQNESAETP